ncbi:hypothetical protein [Caballeronia telluris]|uniref:hypothetical protein n=1 Tax=Caballeronia telluris TaxID=326475 RepID=UPI000F738241|nr:hypothetical protein [Caballeronia telluris]
MKRPGAREKLKSVREASRKRARKTSLPIFILKCCPIIFQALVRQIRDASSRTVRAGLQPTPNYCGRMRLERRFMRVGSLRRRVEQFVAPRFVCVSPQEEESSYRHALTD